MTTFGIQKNQVDQLRKYFTHTQIFVIPNNHEEIEYEAEFGYEVDTRQSKFMSNESSFTLRTGEVGSPWKLRFENTFRKNVIDSFASHEYLRDEIMPTYKQAVGL